VLTNVGHDVEQSVITDRVCNDLTMRGHRDVHRRWNFPILENGVVDRLQILLAEEEPVCRLARYLGGRVLVNDKGPHVRANAVRCDNDVALERLPVEEVNDAGLRILP
jgi:hypothetical protein